MYYLVSGCVVPKSGHMNNSEKEVIIEQKLCGPSFLDFVILAVSAQLIHNMLSSHKYKVKTVQLMGKEKYKIACSWVDTYIYYPTIYPDEITYFLVQPIELLELSYFASS